MVLSRNNLHAAWPCRLLVAAALLVAFGLTTAHAQWEWVYGAANINEGGRRGVQPIAADACGNAAGYISVGWSDATGGGDVYAVRTNCNGQRIWETAIDITGAGDMDRGRAIQPTYNCDNVIDGYVITGWTALTVSGNGTWDVFITKIDCNGNVLWARTYGRPTWMESAHDLIVTRTGDPNGTPATNAGDIVVAGFAFEPTGGGPPPRMHDAYVIRTNNNGVPIVDVAVDNSAGGPATDDLFMALTELSPVAGNVAGDIMGVGISTANNGPHAYAQRFSHDLVCGNGATYGNPGAGFFGVIELQNPAETGPNGWQNVVAVGDNGGAAQILAVKIPDGDPICQAGTIEVNIDDAGGQFPDVAYDVDEVDFVPSASSSLAQWDLVMTGWHVDNAADPGDAFFLAVDPTLNVLFGSSFSAGLGTTGREEGWSIHGDNVSCAQSFIICGNSTSWDAAQDHYLIRTDNNGRTGCENPYLPCDIPQTNCAVVAPDCVPLMVHLRRCPIQNTPVTGLRVCPFPAIEQNPDAPGFSISRPSADGSMITQSLVMANETRMVSSGMPLTVSLKSENAVSVTVSDHAGQVLARYDGVKADKGGEVSVPTFDLLPGNYRLNVEDGSSRTVTRFTVH